MSAKDVYELFAAAGRGLAPTSGFAKRPSRWALRDDRPVDPRALGPRRVTAPNVRRVLLDTSVVIAPPSAGLASVADCVAVSNLLPSIVLRCW